MLIFTADIPIVSKFKSYSANKAAATAAPPRTLPAVTAGAAFLVESPDQSEEVGPILFKSLEKVEVGLASVVAGPSVVLVVLSDRSDDAADETMLE